MRPLFLAQPSPPFPFPSPSTTGDFRLAFSRSHNPFRRLPFVSQMQSETPSQQQQQISSALCRLHSAFSLFPPHPRKFSARFVLLFFNLSSEAPPVRGSPAKFAVSRPNASHSHDSHTLGAAAASSGLFR